MWGDTSSFIHVSRKCSVVKASNADDKKHVMLRRESIKLTHNACSYTECLEKPLSKFGHSWREVMILTKCEGTWDNTICHRYGEEDVHETYE